MRRAWKSILLQLGAIIVFFVLVAAIAIAPWGDGGMRERADAIPIPASWQVTRDNVVPFKLYCLEKSGCPSLEREWKTDRIHSREELEGMLGKAGVQIALSDCTMTERHIDTARLLCTGQANDDGRLFLLRQSTTEEDGVYRVSLTIKRAA